MNVTDESTPARGRGVVFSSGYGDISEESFRIGHMGEHTVESIEELTDAIEDVAGL